MGLAVAVRLLPLGQSRVLRVRRVSSVEQDARAERGRIIQLAQRVSYFSLNFVFRSSLFLFFLIASVFGPVQESAWDRTTTRRRGDKEPPNPNP